MKFTIILLYVYYMSMVVRCDHCKGKTHYDPPREDRMFSVKDNPYSVFLTSDHEVSREACIFKCCNTDKCNILSFNQTLVPPIIDNCFLYFCPSIDSYEYKYAFNIQTFIIREENSTTKETLNPEVDATDAPSENKEVISEKIVDVINDTDVDMNVLDRIPIDTASTLLSSATLSTIPSQSTTTDTLPSTDLSTTNEILSSNSTFVSNPLSTTTTKTSKGSSSLSSPLSSPSSQRTTTIHKSLTSPVDLTNSSSTQAKSSTIHSESENKSSTTLFEPISSTGNEQNNTTITTKTSTFPKPTVTTNNENKSITEQSFVNETNPISKSVENTTQLVVPNITMLQITPPLDSSQNSTVKETKTSSDLQKNTNLPVTLHSSEGVTTSTEVEIVNSTSSSHVLIPATSTTSKVNLTSPTIDYITTKPQTTTAEQKGKTQNNSSTTEISYLPVKTGDKNITFADTHQLKEEREESNVLSAALIAALSFGILFFFAVLVLIGKRCFDSWQRRHYSRIDYLVNGMYN